MKVELQVPKSIMSALKKTPHELEASIRLFAAVKLYELGELSQERAAELAGSSRQEFVLQLSQLKVSPFQGVEEDIATLL